MPSTSKLNQVVAKKNSSAVKTSAFLPQSSSRRQIRRNASSGLNSIQAGHQPRLSSNLSARLHRPPSCSEPRSDVCDAVDRIGSKHSDCPKAEAHSQRQYSPQNRVVSWSSMLTIPKQSAMQRKPSNHRSMKSTVKRSDVARGGASAADSQRSKVRNLEARQREDPELSEAAALQQEKIRTIS